MNGILDLVGFASLLGSAVIGGVFFAFSSFVMQALARLPAAAAVAAMQSINVVVINRSFLGVFMGTMALSLVAMVLALGEFGRPGSLLHLGGGACYFCGTFLVTVKCNVPLNKRLAEIDEGGESAADFWAHYLKNWSKWNHVRTVAAIAAAALFALALFEQATGFK